MNMREFFTLIFKYKFGIAAIFAMVVAVVPVGVLTSKPLYEAKTILLVKPWKEDVPRPGMGEGSSGGAYLSLSQEELVNTEIQILTDRNLAEKVINKLGLASLYPQLSKVSAKGMHPMDLAVGAFAKNLKAVAVRKSNVITVTFQHPEPKLAAAVLNQLVDAFKEKHLALHSDPQSSFIGAQHASFESKLKESERELQKYQQENGVFSLEEQRSLLLKQRSDLGTSYLLAQNSVGELRNKISAIKSQLAVISKTNARYTPTERDKIITEARSRQLELQLKEQELRRKYRETNPLVVEARKEVDLVSGFLKEQEEGIAGKVKTSNPVYQNMEIDLFRAEGELNSQLARAQALSGQVRQLDRQIAQLELSQNRIQNLKREIAINEKNYKAYADRQEEARISEAMNRLKMSNISVVQEAEAPTQPVTLNKVFKLTMGVLVGVLAGLAFAYLCETLGQTFSDPEAIEKYLELPVLLTIPYKED